MVRRRDVYVMFTFLGVCLLFQWNYKSRIWAFPSTLVQFSTLMKDRKTQNNAEAMFGSSSSATVLRRRARAQLGVASKLPELTMDAQNWFYGRSCQENAYRKRLQVVLHEWQALAMRRNITQYFLCFGSFLGSVRNGDLIPYDTDVDVCMFRRDYHKLYPEESKRPLNLNDGKIHLLLQRHSPHPAKNTPRRDCKGRLVRAVVDDCSILDPHARMYNGALIYLDIFMIEDHGSVLWDEYRDVMHRRSVILPVRQCKYLGLVTQCPRSAATYLRAYYGMNYMIPFYVCKSGAWVNNGLAI